MLIIINTHSMFFEKIDIEIIKSGGKGIIFLDVLFLKYLFLDFEIQGRGDIYGGLLNFTLTSNQLYPLIYILQFSSEL